MAHHDALGLSPRLGAHLPEPFVEVHPADAEAAALLEGGFAQVTTRHGSCVLKVVLSAGQRRGSIFAPIHWSDATASSARICDLVMGDTDRYSGQPEAKATPAAIAPVAFAFRGFALTREPLARDPEKWEPVFGKDHAQNKNLERDDDWNKSHPAQPCPAAHGGRVAVAKASGLLFATDDGPETWRERARQMFGDGAELAEYNDARHGIYRAAAFAAGGLAGALFIGPAAAAPQWDAVKPLFAADTLAQEARRVLLSGRSADGLARAGPSSAPASASTSPPFAMRCNRAPPGASKPSGERCAPAPIAGPACPSSSASWRMRGLPWCRQHRHRGRPSRPLAGFAIPRRLQLACRPG